jgi:sulfite reductase (NADPH) hemoprotein beta-component
MTKFKHPQILLASNLKDGEVVFLGHNGWERDFRHARIAKSQEEAQILETIGKAGYSANIIVDVYLTEVEITDDGAPIPLHYREKMRIKGPSVRHDLGKQARGVPDEH